MTDARQLDADIRVAELETLIAAHEITIASLNKRLPEFIELRARLARAEADTRRLDVLASARYLSASLRPIASDGLVARMDFDWDRHEPDSLRDELDRLAAAHVFPNIEEPVLSPSQDIATLCAKCGSSAELHDSRYNDEPGWHEFAPSMSLPQ